MQAGNKFDIVQPLGKQNAQLDLLCLKPLEEVRNQMSKLPAELSVFDVIGVF